MNGFHTPALLLEAVTGLHVVPGEQYIDATVGGGGHAVQIVKRGGVLLGIDADGEAVDFARKSLSSEFTNRTEGKDWKVVRGNFRDIEGIATENGFASVAGVLFDLGVSSQQLDSPEAGFSYRFDSSPLLMRYDRAGGDTAVTLIERASEEELYEIFAKFGEEERARAISHALIRSRAVNPIVTAGQLRSVIEGVVRGKKQRIRALSKIFQAIRIAVNDELEALRTGLVGAEHVVQPGGRLVVISFHSLEDRLVKQFIRNNQWQVITKKPIVPKQAEVESNPRARSAKLRIAQKV